MITDVCRPKHETFHNRVLFRIVQVYSVFSQCNHVSSDDESFDLIS